MRRPVVVLCAVLAPTAANAQALIGQWTFDPGVELVDRTGNWAPLTLVGTAAVANGRLDVNSTGTTATGWAWGTGYTGTSNIRSKTLVSWVSLQSLTLRSGSGLTIDNMVGDNFDALVYAENTALRWMPGSSNGLRNQAAMTFDETVQGQILTMAISYEDLGSGNTRITLCRNGVQLGQYTDSPMAEWTPTNAQVILGARHDSDAHAPIGGFDAEIAEARLYSGVLTCAQTGALVLFVDADGDGVSDDQDACQGSNATNDTDGDLVCNDLDTDDDQDTIPDVSDNCPVVSNTAQTDLDEDDIGDACDLLVCGTQWFIDSDGDGHGHPSAHVWDCVSSPLPGYSLSQSDCNDADADVNPDEIETTCNATDDDCNPGTLDTPDVDLDGSDVCADCDDADPANEPGGTEICDGKDNDCDDAPDNGLTFVTYYADTDADGFGDTTATAQTCTGAAPTGYVAVDGDCATTDATVSPDATEATCDGIDQDCDGAGGPEDDDDEDGLTNAEELEDHETDPCNVDSDGDGASDGDEVDAGTDPNVADEPEDTDPPETGETDETGGTTDTGVEPDGSKCGCQPASTGASWAALPLLALLLRRRRAV